MRTGVVGAIADVGVGLVRRLHVGADAAVPEQVDLHREDRAHQLLAAHVLRLEAQALAQRGGHGDALGAARKDAAARGESIRAS